MLAEQLACLGADLLVCGRPPDLDCFRRSIFSIARFAHMRRSM
jgi:hypothetical protein